MRAWVGLMPVVYQVGTLRPGGNGVPMVVADVMPLDELEARRVETNSSLLERLRPDEYRSRCGKLVPAMQSLGACQSQGV